MGKFCKYCGSSNLKIVDQKFKDGSDHQRIECRDCDKFNGYAKQNNGFDTALVVNFDFYEKGCIDDLAQIMIEKLISLELKGHKITVILKAR